MFGCVMLNSALRAGARMVTLARFELDAFLGMVQDHRVTAVAVVPPIAEALARHPAVDRYDLSSLRFILVGAAPCPAEIERECAARLGCVVAQGLGMTEAAPLALPEDPVCHGSVGRLVAGTQAVIVDPESGARLGEGRTGELWVRGPQLMRGYLGDDAATTATVDPEGWLHTGDLGRFDGAGNLFLTDRLKELIKVRGYQVAPAQLEAELSAHPAVADVAVVPRPDARVRTGPGGLRHAVRAGRAGGDRRVARRARGALQAPGRGRRRGRDPARADGQAAAARPRRARALRATRALLGVGFTHEGVLRHWHRHGEDYYDVNVFGMLRSDWESGPLAGVAVTVEGAPPPAFVARL